MVTAVDGRYRAMFRQSTVVWVGSRAERKAVTEGRVRVQWIRSM